MKPRVYYAHPINIYNSPRERRDLEALEYMGFEVVNPNGPEHDAGYREEGMDYFYDLVGECDGIAFRAFADGNIPAGVAKEVNWMVVKGGFVIELPTCIDRRTCDVEDTRTFLRESGRGE